MALAPDSPLARLMQTFPRAGKLTWIGVRPAPHAPLVALDHVEALADRGLVGDRKVGASGRGTGGKRQVSLIQHEHLQAVAALLGVHAIDPLLTRRNLVVSGINLYALRDARFTMGDVLFEGAGPCEPCSRMETNLGAGGYNALRGHGGIVARVIEGGVIALGDAVVYRGAVPRGVRGAG